MEDSSLLLSLSLYFILFILYLLFLCVLQFWGCSAPYSRILGVLKHLQHPLPMPLTESAGCKPPALHPGEVGGDWSLTPPLLASPGETLAVR